MALQSLKVNIAPTVTEFTMSSLLPVEPSRLHGASLLVHISEGQAIDHTGGAGWYHYSDILALKGFTPRVSQCAVSASTKLCGGTCVWMDWLDPMWLNHSAVFHEVVAPPVIKLGSHGVYTTAARRIIHRTFGKTLQDMYQFKNTTLHWLFYKWKGIEIE